MVRRILYKRKLIFAVLYACSLFCAGAQDFEINTGYYYSTYSRKTQCSRQVEYILKPLNPVHVRRNKNLKFSSNVGTISLTATHEDYTNTGYDRGHLCPAGDMAFSYSAMLATFSVANIAPQVPKLNRGIWKSTENYLRHNVTIFDSIRIVVIPLWLHRDTTRIGVHKIAVPHAFIKLAFKASNDSLINQYFFWNKTTQ